jgi:DNA-binding response OmpR family regulator
VAHKPPLILIVDDEPAVLEGLRLAFEDTNWHAEVATSAATGLARFRDKRPDLILVDKNLPDMNGVELIRKIRAEDGDVRIIMITGFPSLGSAIETANLGIDAYLGKPFTDVFAITRMVRSLLDKDRPSLARRIAQLFARPESEAAKTSREATLKLAIASEFETRKAIAQHVSGKGRRLWFADSSTEELLELLPREKPQVVFVQGVPDVSEVVRQIRAKQRDIVVVVLGEELELPLVIDLIANQVTAIVQDPIGSEAFLERIRKVLDAVEAESK